MMALDRHRFTSSKQVTGSTLYGELSRCANFYICLEISRVPTTVLYVESCELALSCVSV